MKASFMATMILTIGFTSAAVQRRVTSKSSKAHQASMKKFVGSALSMSMSLPLLPIPVYTEFGSSLFDSSSTSPSTAPSELGSNIFVPSITPSLSLSSTTQSHSPTWITSSTEIAIASPSLPTTEDEKYCGSDHDNDTKSHIKLEYLYRLESVSFVSSLIIKIENLLLQIACSVVHNERSLWSRNKTAAPVYTEITAAPKDVVSSACEFAKLLLNCCPSHDQTNVRFFRHMRSS